MAMDLRQGTRAAIAGALIALSGCEFTSSLDERVNAQAGNSLDSSGRQKDQGTILNYLRDWMKSSGGEYVVTPSKVNDLKKLLATRPELAGLEPSDFTVRPIEYSGHHLVNLRGAKDGRLIAVLKLESGSDKLVPATRREKAISVLDDYLRTPMALDGRYSRIESDQVVTSKLLLLQVSTDFANKGYTRELSERISRDLGLPNDAAVNLTWNRTRGGFSLGLRTNNAKLLSASYQNLQEDQYSLNNLLFIDPTSRGNLSELAKINPEPRESAALRACSFTQKLIQEFGIDFENWNKSSDQGGPKLEFKREVEQRLLAMLSLPSDAAVDVSLGAGGFLLTISKNHQLLFEVRGHVDREDPSDVFDHRTSGEKRGTTFHETPERPRDRLFTLRDNAATEAYRYGDRMDDIKDSVLKTLQRYQDDVEVFDRLKAGPKREVIEAVKKAFRASSDEECSLSVRYTRTDIHIELTDTKGGLAELHLNDGRLSKAYVRPPNTQEVRSDVNFEVGRDVGKVFSDSCRTISTLANGLYSWDTLKPDQRSAIASTLKAAMGVPGDAELVVSTVRDFGKRDGQLVVQAKRDFELLAEITYRPGETSGSAYFSAFEHYTRPFEVAK